MTDHWIMDASPLILLGQSVQLEWLPRMGHIVVPESVAAEVAAGSPDDPARLWLETSVGKSLIKSDVKIADDLLAWDLGRGEHSVIAFAMALSGYEAVLDDAAARRCAAVFGVRLRGTLSLVALAKKTWAGACLQTGV